MALLCSSCSGAALVLAGVHRDGEGKEGSVFYLFLRDTLH